MGIFKKKKVVLVLGGGGARGLSNVGVLKALERHFGVGKMPFDMVIGTSIGSLIGAAHCLGCSLLELEEMALKFSWPNIVDFGFHATGLIRGDKFEKIISEIIKDRGFKDMKIPFALTTVNIETGEAQTHSSGNLVKLIRASCSWPGIFAAVEIDGKKLVDGGVRNSIPTKAAWDFGASFIVAVNPGFGVKNHKVYNVLKALIQSVQILGDELNAYQAKEADIVIKPDLGDLDQFDFDKAAFIIKQGELACIEKMGVIKRWLK